MSPVDQSRNHVGRAASVALVGIFVLGFGLFAATYLLKDRNSADLQLGDQTFQAGNAAEKAELIAETGPIPYPDVSGRNERPIFLQHLGDDPETGWYAFLAFPTAKGADCPWEWDASDELFRATCDPELTAPADGKGVQQFKVTVTDGSLEVDLNAEARAQASSTTTTEG